MERVQSDEAKIEAVIRIFDQEIIRDIGTTVVCPRGGTCECPGAHALARKYSLSTHECASGNCPVHGVHEQYLTLLSN